MKKNVFAMTVLIAFTAWSCSKVENSGSGLRQSVEKGVADISHAVTTISGTTGYQLITMNGNVAKSDFVMNDTINMSMVSGIYDFQPDTVLRYHHFSPYKLFKKTGESDNMVINMPDILVMHPKRLYFYQLMDSVYADNFTITATDYHLYFSLWHNYDYKLTAGFSLNNENAGIMDVSTIYNKENSSSNTSSYTFENGYNIATVWQDGDPATSLFSLSNAGDTLFKEKNMYSWHGFHKSEKQYDLTIGDVQIKKTTGIDSIQVFVAGVLQQHSASIISDDTDSTSSICQKRDILLTYDDGTTAKLSSLMDPIKAQINLLRDSLRSMYFSKHIIDYIAFSIYYDTHPYLY